MISVGKDNLAAAYKKKKNKNKTKTSLARYRNGSCNNLARYNPIRGHLTDNHHQRPENNKKSLSTRNSHYI